VSETTLGALEGPVRQRLEQIEKDQVVRRLLGDDASLWKSDPAVQQEIRDRLGWLKIIGEDDQASAGRGSMPTSPAGRTVNWVDLPGRMRIAELATLRSQLYRDGFRHAVVLGMGGSSLAPEVFALTFPPAAGALAVHVMDTTDPAAIQALEQSIEIAQTVFIVASKSGTTLETLSHYHYFWERTGGKANQFIAITDPGTSLAAEAEKQSFRRVYLNREDIGGRYSALSYFGLVPTALGGVDLEAVESRAGQMVQACSASVPAARNPGTWLGAVFAESAKAGRDKITIIAPQGIPTFGTWAEQLIAESTGKEGKGLVPVALESLGSPEVYGNDRLFVQLEVTPSPALPTRGREPAQRRELDALVRAGHPVVTLQLDDPLALGAEFFRWEFAIAVAGSILGINVFDQPNVQEAKDLTARVLKESTPPTVGDGIRWAGQNGSTLEAAVQNLLGQIKPGDYFAVLAYLAPDDEHDSALNAIRLAVRDRYRVATTVGYGPRYLHSTGQLHKGGPNTGVFLEIVGDDVNDINIPGQPFSFGVLKQAQALGDFQALRNHGRRVVRVQLRDVASGLVKIGQAVGARVEVA